MESIFCVEQIHVPPELGTIMKQYTKAVLRDRPGDLYKYSANFFAALCGQSAPFDNDGQLVKSDDYASMNHFIGAEPREAKGMEISPSLANDEGKIVLDIFSHYDVHGDGRIAQERVPLLLEDLQKAFGLSESQTIGEKELLDLLDADENGTVDLLELRQIFFPPSASP